MKTLEETILDLHQIQTTIQTMKSALEVLEQEVDAILDELNGYAIKE